MSIIKLYNTPPWEWPDNAGKTIYGVLCDVNVAPGERTMAAELAGDVTVIDDHMAKTLLSILQNNAEDDMLRCQAAISLGPVLEETYLQENDEADEIEVDMGLSFSLFEEMQRDMQHIYMNADVPQLVRRRSLEASVRAPRQWHRNAVRAAYASGNYYWQLTAVFCMGYVDGFNDQIIEALTDERKSIRFEAVCAAGNQGLTAAWPHIQKILKDAQTDKDLLVAAIDAVAPMHPEKAGGVVGPFIESPDPDIAEAALECLFMADALLDLDDDDLEDFIDDDIF
ncbi:MAG: hypothetical protein SWH68_12975 [Thermodesulfobacteriota bacterium]|nr:hypothetical protein [Thermodesulfobacteriota bacterium]